MSFEIPQSLSTPRETNYLHLRLAKGFFIPRPCHTSVNFPLIPYESAMLPHAILPVEIRLMIYEIRLIEWVDGPAIWAPDSSSALDLMVRMPVPAVLQAEAGEVRPRLLKWLAKHKHISPAESAPTLRFPDREFSDQHDFLSLQSPWAMDNFEHVIESIWSREDGITYFGWMPRRIAVPPPTCHTKSLHRFLGILKVTYGVDELAFAVLEQDDGKLRVIVSTPKKNPAAYTLEQISCSDFKRFPAELRRSIEAFKGREGSIRVSLDSEWNPIVKDLKITWCKMIPR